MKTYTIVAGVNGCGKSSLIGVLKTEIYNIGKIIDIDKPTEYYIEEYYSGENSIEECFNKRINFAVETTLSGKKALATIIRAIKEDYYIRLYYVGLDTVEESLLRIENRVKKGGHNIAKDVVEDCFNSRFEKLPTILPYCDEATFYDNDNGFTTVAKYKNGELQTIGNKKPKWLIELMEKLN